MSFCPECGELAHETEASCKNCGASLPARPDVLTTPPKKGLGKSLKVALALALAVSIILITFGIARTGTGPKLVRAPPSEVLVNLSDFPNWNGTGVLVQSSSAESNPAWRDFLSPDNSSANYTLWVDGDADAARSRMNGIVGSWPYATGALQVTGADAAEELLYARNLSSLGMVVLRYNVVYMEVLSGGPCQYPYVSALSLPTVGPAFCAIIDFGAPGPAPPPQVQKIDSFAQPSY